jgi:hypothetical protein
MWKTILQMLKFLLKKKNPSKVHTPDPLSLESYIGDKFPEYQAEWTPKHERSAKALLKRVKKAMLILSVDKPVINSGWRPAAYNKKIGGARKSHHIKAKAIDIGDRDKRIASILCQRPQILDHCDLWIEHPDHTPTWVHFQSRPPRSGKRIFIP